MQVRTGAPRNRSSKNDTASGIIFSRCRVWRPNPQATGELRVGQDPAPFATDKDRLEYFAGVLQSSKKYLVFPVDPNGHSDEALEYFAGALVRSGKYSVSSTIDNGGGTRTVALQLPMPPRGPPMGKRRLEDDGYGRRYEPRLERFYGYETTAERAARKARSEARKAKEARLAEAREQEPGHQDQSRERSGEKKKSRRKHRAYVWERAHKDYGDDEAGPDPKLDLRNAADRA